MQNVEEKTVDIDTSGPGAEVELPEEQTTESNIEVSNETENNTESNDSAEKSDEQSTVQADTTTDQGTEEKNEEKKNELEDYSETVKRRIAKLTRKMREAERREQAALDYAKRVQVEQENLKSRFSKLDTGYVSEMENRIKSSMEAVAARLAKAREDGDLKAEIAAQTEISKLGYEEARLAEIKSKQVVEPKAEERVVKQPEIQRQVQEQPINPDPKAQQWAEKNTWFGQDEAMTYTAFSLHKKLVEEEGYDPQTDEYYSEIDKRIKLEFPHKFDSVSRNTTSKPTQVVASANRSSKPGRKSVRLTPSQVAIANKLGVPLEEYAKQLNLITKE
jgi:chromosome segregation ATPase